MQKRVIILACRLSAYNRIALNEDCDLRNPSNKDFGFIICFIFLLPQLFGAIYVLCAGLKADICLQKFLLNSVLI